MTSYGGEDNPLMTSQRGIQQTNTITRRRQQQQQQQRRHTTTNNQSNRSDRDNDDDGALAISTRHNPNPTQAAADTADHFVDLEYRLVMSFLYKTRVYNSSLYFYKE